MTQSLRITHSLSHTAHRHVVGCRRPALGVGADVRAEEREGRTRDDRVLTGCVLLAEIFGDDVVERGTVLERLRVETTHGWTQGVTLGTSAARVWLGSHDSTTDRCLHKTKIIVCFSST